MRMKLQKSAVAGTLESCDAMIAVEPADITEIHIESSVLEVFGDEIRQCMEDTLEKLGISGVNVFVQDRGALNCTLAARLETAVRRAAEGGRKE